MVTDVYTPVDSLLNGSVMAIPEVDYYPHDGGLLSDVNLGVAVIILLALLLVSAKNFFPWLGSMFKYVSRPVRMSGMSRSDFFDRSLLLTFIISVPIVVVILNKQGIVPDDSFLELGGILYAVFFCRYFLFYLIREVSFTGELFGIVNRVSLSFFIIGTMVLIVSVPFLFFSLGSLSVLRMVILSAVGFVVLLYVIDVFRIIISSQMPLFFSFLYLCTLEILPLCLVVVALVRN